MFLKLVIFALVIACVFNGFFLLWSWAEAKNLKRIKVLSVVLSCATLIGAIAFAVSYLQTL